MDDRPFVMNLADAPVLEHPRAGAWLKLEPEGVHWPEIGLNVHVLQPGLPNCRYHHEPVQEDFLVLHGECLVILDGEEQRLRQWDFVHCPAGAAHVFVGAGDGPCAVLMVGSRRRDEAHYPVSAVAARWGASVTAATDVSAEAYADWDAEAPDRPAANPWPLSGPE